MIARWIWRNSVPAGSNLCVSQRPSRRRSLTLSRPTLDALLLCLRLFPHLRPFLLRRRSTQRQLLLSLVHQHHPRGWLSLRILPLFVRCHVPSPSRRLALCTLIHLVGVSLDRGLDLDLDLGGNLSLGSSSEGAGIWEGGLRVVRSGESFVFVEEGWEILMKMAGWWGRMGLTIVVGSENWWRLESPRPAWVGLGIIMREDFLWCWVWFDSRLFLFVILSFNSGGWWVVSG